MKYKVFVINLARSTERLASMQKQLSVIDVAFERIDAIDGQLLSASDIEEISPSRAVKNNYYRPLGKGEVACFLSHRVAWQQIVDQELDFAIILEDDLEILEHFTDVVDILSSIPSQHWDYIKLFPLTRSGPGNLAQTFDYRGYTFVTYKKLPLSCVGQAVSFRGAKQLIQHSGVILEPVDSFLKAWWNIGIYPYGLMPYCVTTEIGNESDINPEGGLEKIKQNKVVKIKKKLQRGIQRLRYQSSLFKQFDAFCNSLID